MPAESLIVTPRITIPRDELQFTFVASGGPGGQHVNKVATKAVLRWQVRESTSLPEDVRARFLARYARRINSLGEVILSSQRYRDQSRNLDDCLQKLRELVQAVAVAPKPRKKSRPSRAAVESRLREKRAVAEKKRRRRTPPASE